jgi:hypothetical protein
MQLRKCAANRSRVRKGAVKGEFRVLEAWRVTDDEVMKVF